MAWYPWIKALHVIAIIAWMAGLLYLPRLFVYHSVQKPGSDPSEMLKIMEHRLLKFIMNPAMIFAWIAGLWLVTIGGFWTEKWFIAKLTFVFVLSGFHGFLSAEQKRFAADRRERSARFYRIINEVPTILMIGIVLLVIIKP